MSRRKKFIARVTALTIAVFAFPALGAYTPVMFDSEPNHAQIFSDAYGGTFTASGLNFSNGSITALRVNDLNGEGFSLNIITDGPDAVDQIWTDGITKVTATAKHASMIQSFGWNGGGSDSTTYVELINESVLSETFEVDGDFLWGIHPTTDVEEYYWWSRDSLNDDTMDHMVTYKIEGLLTAETVWMTFWEDQPSNKWDQDYNDYVVEISAIPEPATLLLLGMGGLSLLSRKRRA